MIRQYILWVCFGIIMIFCVIMLFKKIREMNEYEKKIEKERDKDE